MLQQVRKSLKSALMGLVLGLMAVSLVGFGLTGVFSAGANFAAKVGDTTIAPGELQREAYNQFARFQQFQPELTPEQARQVGVGRFALSALLSRAVIAEEASKMRLAVSDERLIDEIRSIEAFQNPATGEFDRRSYQLAIARGNFDETEFEEGLREDLVRGQLIDAVTGASAALPDVIALASTRYALQRRAVRYVTLQPSSVELPESFDDATLEARIALNPTPFERPERRAGVAVVVDPAQFDTDLEVSDEELRALYDDENAAAPETRDLVLLPFGPGDEAGARAIAAADRLRAEPDADVVIRDEGFNAAQTRLDDATTADIADAETAERAFAMEPGAVEAFEGALGWFAIKVESVNAPERPSFEERRDALKEEFRNIEAVERAYDAADAVDDAVADGASLEEAGELAGATLMSLDLDAEGRRSDEGDASALDVALAQELFQLREGEIGGLVETDDGAFFIARLDQITPRAAPPLEEIREDVEAAERNARIEDALLSLANALRADAVEQGGLTAAAEARGLPITEVENGVARNRPEEIIAPQDATTIVGLGEGGLHVGDARYGLAWYVAEAGALIEPTLSAEMVSQFRNQQGGDYVRAAIDGYLNEARSNIGVTVRQDVVDAALDAAF